MRVFKLVVVLLGLLVLARQYPDYVPSFDKIIKYGAQRTGLASFHHVLAQMR